MSIGIIIFAVFSLFFFVRAMARQDPGQRLFGAIVDLICLAILLATGTPLDSGDAYVVIGILGLDLAGAVVSR